MTIASPTETEFTLTIDAEEIRVRYRPNYVGGIDPHALIEFTSPHEPRRSIPVSDSGYRSFFARMSDIEAAPDIEKYTGFVAMFLMIERRGAVAADAVQTDLG